MVTPVKAKITAENAREAWSTAPEEMNDWPTRNDWKGVEDISEAGGGSNKSQLHNHLQCHLKRLLHYMSLNWIISFHLSICRRIRE
jgi:hypothetical protein